MADIFNLLESNQPHAVEDIKKQFHEFFNTTKESWILDGLVHYYTQTNSIRCVEIIASVREPHYKYLFERIDDGLKQQHKLQLLTLLGHVVRKQPPWLYTITQHPLFKNLLKFLKTETEIVPLMSALLVLIVLLPMIPALVGPHLNDIFEVFSRLASWTCKNPGQLTDEQLVHLQVSMYALFLRLYGMYPCNFLSYLRHEYGVREQQAVFTHTIKPMLDTVKMHPSLVTATKDAEIATTRWKKMGHHDVIVECAKLSLDPTERSKEESYSYTSSFRSRSATEHPILFDVSHPYQMQLNQPMGNLNIADEKFFSPTKFFLNCTSPPIQELSAPTSIPQTPINPQNFVTTSTYVNQEGTSPPEAAIEATPDTTPIKDPRLTSKTAPVNSSVVRALNNFTTSKWPSVPTTPTQSQPSSPMKKEMSPFRFPAEIGSSSAFEQPKKDADSKKDSASNQRLNRLLHDRMVTKSPAPTDKSSWHLRSKTPLTRLPTSPLRVIPGDSSVPNSPVPIEMNVPTPGGKDWLVAKPKAEKNGFKFESTTQDSSQEDQEVVEIVRQGEHMHQQEGASSAVSASVQVRHCDSVLQDVMHPRHDDEDQEICACDQSCSSGGLHMPNSQSMREFHRKVHRLRYYSHCVTDTTVASEISEFSTGSSPGDQNILSDMMKVRRANSCPEMKKGSQYTIAAVDKDLNESDEINEAPTMSILDKEKEEDLSATVKEMKSSFTQTIDNWPLPYEHLFEGLFPGVEGFNEVMFAPSGDTSSDTKKPTEIKSKLGEVWSSPASSPGPSNARFSPYKMLDKYIEVAVQGSDREMRRGKVQGYESELKALREQLDLVHMQLQFERHRREVHSERNRRLMGKSKDNRALEELNSALRDQLTLLQKDNDVFHQQLLLKARETSLKDKETQDLLNYWQNECMLLQEQKKTIKQQLDETERRLREQTEKANELDEEYQHSEAVILELRNEVQLAGARVSTAEKLRFELEHAHKQLLLAGELQIKLQEKFAQLPALRCRDEELKSIVDTYTQEIKGLIQLSDVRNSIIESYKTRINDLENVISKHDEACSEQKRLLKVVKEEYQEQLNSVESKYQTQRRIISGMEKQMLELQARLYRAEHAISKGHEIGGSGSDGLSPHASPPLSVSLTSSEGGASAAFLQSASDVREIRNLQNIVDQTESGASTNDPTIVSEDIENVSSS